MSLHLSQQVVFQYIGIYTAIYIYSIIVGRGTLYEILLGKLYFVECSYPLCYLSEYDIDIPI